MSERTEEQIISMEPIKAILGGKPVEIPLLKLKDSRKWKAKWWNVIFGADGYKEAIGKVARLQESKATAEELGAALSDSFEVMLLKQPEQAVKLVCSYINYSGLPLTEEEINNTANEAEIAVLWEKINEVAFPLVTSLANALNRKK